ncbi:DUF4156 domain-containing protein [Campylobacter cuniculorum]|uniref:DUF4156 domain-containing protein n=2 Tax=Campylobacter cuniculorum TaxID=374106 RepID=A0A1W6BZC8_9BACT|nr:DUF4156 domain-containing protein [Campylobacter cuniculorum]ARJ57434.1 hypothetical protein CCUN_1872 [Campylobacter cuniculorum DSM 23162 = LMG 24588]QOR04871.1 DUF4156 domain-containing protein [Campylobacter cuniculorum]
MLPKTLLDIKNKKLFIILWVFIIIFVGCTQKTELLPLAKNIKVLYEKPQNCILLGREIGQKIDTMNSMSLLELRESALNDLKNKTSILMGDTLHILNMEKGWNAFWEGNEYLIEGEIYKCE